MITATAIQRTPRVQRLIDRALDLGLTVNWLEDTDDPRNVEILNREHEGFATKMWIYDRGNFVRIYLHRPTGMMQITQADARLWLKVMSSSVTELDHASIVH